MQVRLDPEVAALIAARAKENHRSKSREANFVLRALLGRRKRRAAR